MSGAPDELPEGSPHSETPADTSVTTAVDATTDGEAASSPAPGVKEDAPLSLLDVVKNVVSEPAAEEQPEASPAAEGKKEGEDADPDAPSEELTEAEIEALPFGKHPRFKEILDQKNAFKAERDGALEKVRELEAPAQQWTAVREFMEQNSLSDDDMLTGFKMMAMLRTDPLKGRAELANYLTEVDRALGLILPDDLRADVDSGAITEERAFELSRARASSAAQERVTEAQRGEQESRDRAQAAAELADTLTQAAEDWTTAKRGADPDFGLKEDLIADRMKALALAERLQPKSKAEIEALLDRAHKDVTAHLRKLRPAPKEIARPTQASGPTVAVSEPKSVKDAVLRGLQT